MNTNYPQRPQAHQLEEASRRFFEQCLPVNWTAEKPTHDYGVDLRVDIFEEQSATGLELLIQLKASEESTHGYEEFIKLRTTTYNMLHNKLQIVMLVKYSRTDNEAYWLLFKDAGAPQENKESVTIRIPKTNQLSQIDWEFIQNYIRSVTDEKLAAKRREAHETTRSQI